MDERIKAHFVLLGGKNQMAVDMAGRLPDRLPAPKPTPTPVMADAPATLDLANRMVQEVSGHAQSYWTGSGDGKVKVLRKKASYLRAGPMAA